MKKSILFAILLFSFILVNGQYYRERIGVKIGFPNVFGITNEFMLLKKVGLTTDFSYNNFISRSWLFIYGDIGLRKYAGLAGKGYYLTVGTGYIFSEKEQRITRIGFTPRFGMGYHVLVGRFSLSPEIGGMYLEYQPEFYTTIAIGMALYYK